MKNKISESRVILENGKIKNILSEEIQNNGGWMSVEEAIRLCHEAVDIRRKELQKQKNNF